MKKIDIRKVYVCEILKQNEVYQKQSQNTWDVVFLQDTSYVWDYEKESQLGLFVKTPIGYKHIVTDVVYPMPSKRTGNKHVINPKNIERLVVRERARSSHIIGKYRSYNIDVGVYAVLEELINEENKYGAEEQDNEII